MNATDTIFVNEHQNAQSNDLKRWALVVATALLLAALTVVGIIGLSGQKWVLVIGAVAAPIVAYGMLTRPQVSTYLAVFLLYTNMPVVAMTIAITK